MYYMLCKKNNPQTPDRDTQGKLFNDCRSGQSSEMDQKCLQINLKIFARNVTKRFTTLFNCCGLIT